MRYLELVMLLVGLIFLIEDSFEQSQSYQANFPCTNTTCITEDNINHIYRLWDVCCAQVACDFGFLGDGKPYKECCKKFCTQLYLDYPRLPCKTGACKEYGHAIFWNGTSWH